MPRIDDYFEAACRKKASDIHLTSGQPPLIRLHGKIQALEEGHAPLGRSEVEALLLEIAPEENRAQFEARGDTDFAHEFGDEARFRVNLFRDRNGPGGVFRRIPREIISAEKLGLSKEILELCSLTKGLVLVTGPTGSGKSTTLCALVDYINRTRDEHIITIEDPVEFIHETRRCLVNQREVGTDTASFKSALKAALREDPNVIVVGELRDLETTAIAIEMAETGHLVFGTLHTTTAASTVDRIIDQFPHEQQAQIRTMLSSSLRGVIAQTLCRKKDGSGRVAALEVLLATPSLAANIREGKTHQIPLAMQTGRKLGMCELNQALVQLVQDQSVAAEEALRKAVDKPGLLRELDRLGIAIGAPNEPVPAAPVAPPARPVATPKATGPKAGTTLGGVIVKSKDQAPRSRTSGSRRRPSNSGAIPKPPKATAPPPTDTSPDSPPKASWWSKP